jgi:hypothetical protein
LIGPAGQPIKASVTIIPGEKYPFDIIEVKARNGKRIRHSWSVVKGPKGMQYRLTVKNIKTGKGRYMDTISVKTTSKYRPVINIEVFGDII